MTKSFTQVKYVLLFVTLLLTIPKRFHRSPHESNQSYINITTESHISTVRDNSYSPYEYFVKRCEERKSAAKMRMLTISSKEQHGRTHRSKITQFTA